MSSFMLGHVVATPNAISFAADNELDLGQLIMRHLACDWGDLDREDKKRNDEALVDGSRIFSSYKVSSGKIWIITESDRSSTCVLLPEDY